MKSEGKRKKKEERIITRRKISQNINTALPVKTMQNVIVCLLHFPEYDGNT